MTSFVAKHKPAATFSLGQSDRQLSTGASRATGPRLAASTDADSARSREIGISTEMLLTTAKRVSDDVAARSDDA